MRWWSSSPEREMVPWFKGDGVKNRLAGMVFPFCDVLDRGGCFYMEGA